MPVSREEDNEKRNRKSAVRQRAAKDKAHYRDIQQIAREACRPKTEESFYPEEFYELARILAPGGHTQAPIDYPGHDRARSIIARGIPYQEITRRDGSTRAPHLKGDEVKKAA